MSKFYDFNGIYLDIEEVAAFHPLYGGKLRFILRGGANVDIDVGKIAAEVWVRQLAAQLKAEGKFPTEP
jgi:hypothetical protein